MKEAVLHQIWKSGFGPDNSSFTTVCGTSVRILEPGINNSGDGPDFRFARIRLANGLILAGDIEIHTDERDWKHHGHHNDPAYNSVILHVVLHTGRHRAQTRDGYRPLTVTIPAESVSRFLQKASRGGALPCSGKITPVSQEVIQKQFQAAREAYFEIKVNRLTERYDASLPLSEAWPQMLAVHTGDGLGISKNREPMAALATALFAHARVNGTDALKSEAIRLAGLNEGSTLLKRIDWDLSGARPGNRPEDRIPALAEFITRLHTVPPARFREDPDHIWHELTSGIKGQKRRFSLLYLTVYLPMLYLLGSLIFDRKLRHFAWETWNRHRFSSPASIRALFRKSGFPAGAIPDHLGPVHQYRHYCSAGKCSDCRIMHAVTGKRCG